jgi:tol-pal system protein YbgF
MMTGRPYKLLILVVTAGLLAVTPQLVRAQGSSDLIYQVQELLEEVRELRGMVEAQQREIENLRRRQRDQYLDLDQRLQQSDPASSPRLLTEAPRAEDVRPLSPPQQQQAPREQAPAEQASADVPEVRAPIETSPEITTLPAPAAAGPRDLGTPSAEEQAIYDRAFRALRETRYADAAQGFSEFLDSFPDSAYAPNAQYWLAETYYVTRDFETALRFFNQLLNRYPGSNKQGDALLKIGFSHFEMRQWNEARAALEQVRSQYPDTTLARLAESRLRDMRLAGHY